MKQLVAISMLLFVLGWAGWSQAAITCTNTDFVYTTNTIASPTITITVPAQTHRRSVIHIHDYTDETTTISSVTEDNGGTWAQVGSTSDMSTGATSRMWFYERTGGNTGSTTITVNFSGAINSALTAGTCYSDTASLDYVSSAAHTEHAAVTAWASNSRTYTTTGIIIGPMASTGGNSVISTVGTNQTRMVSDGGSRRSHIVVRAESSGTQALDMTMSFNVTGMWGAHLYQEASAAGVTPRGMLLGVYP
jgi:hypothetical protein